MLTRRDFLLGAVAAGVILHTSTVIAKASQPATTVKSDEEKNRLCPPIAYWDTNTEYLSAFLASLANERARAAYPALASWAKETRLNPRGGITRHRDHPSVIDARESIERFGAAAAINLVKLLSPSDSDPASSQTSGERTVRR